MRTKTQGVLEPPQASHGTHAFVKLHAHRARTEFTHEKHSRSISKDPRGQMWLENLVMWQLHHTTAVRKNMGRQMLGKPKLSLNLNTTHLYNIPEYIHTCTPAYMPIHTQTHTYLHTCSHILMHMYVHMHTYKHAYTIIYSNAYLHT